MTDLCHIDSIPEREARGFEVNGQHLLVVKKHGAVYVYHNSCPHTGINLDWLPDDFMSFDNQYLQCSTHGAQFQIEDGLCVAGPCKGQVLTATPFKIINGRIIVDFGDDDKA